MPLTDDLKRLRETHMTRRAISDDNRPVAYTYEHQVNANRKKRIRKEYTTEPEDDDED